MQGSRGNLSVHRLFGIKELGLRDPEPHVDRVINIFLSIGEAVAARWIQLPKGILLLQMAPNNPASGAIYVYDRTNQDFYMISFEGSDDTLTLDDFSKILPEYDLLRYAEQPALLQAHSGRAGCA
jgi:hypothetical protein